RPTEERPQLLPHRSAEEADQKADDENEQVGHRARYAAQQPSEDASERLRGGERHHGAVSQQRQPAEPDADASDEPSFFPGPQPTHHSCAPRPGPSEKNVREEGEQKSDERLH